MIDYPGQETDRIDPPGVPDDVLMFGQNAGTLAQIAASLAALVQASRRGETPNPSTIFLANGRDPAFVPQTTARMRGSFFVFANVSLGVLPIGLQIGSAVIPLLTLGNGQTVYIPFPTIIDAGTSLTLWNMTTNAALDGTKCIAYVYAYTELETRQP